MPEPQRVDRFRKQALALLLCYWLALTLSTHWPLNTQVLLGKSDKVVHLSAFFVLALLVCLNWALRATFGWRQWLAAAGLVVAYGAIDEWTQRLTGRYSDLRDWYADSLGALAGVATFVVAAVILRRASRRPGEPGRAQ